MKRAERETIIVYNERGPAAEIIVNNTRLRNRLEQLRQDRPGEVSVDGRGCYHIPKDWVRINPSRELTERQKEEKAARLARVNRKRAFSAQNPR